MLRSSRKEIDVTAAGQTETIRDISWLPFGPRTEAKFPPYDTGAEENVVVSGRAYNLRGQVAEIDVAGPQGVVLDRSYTYDYTAGSPGPNDPGPNLDRMEDGRDSTQSRFYFYDELDRLGDSKLLSGAADEGFLYDASGNRTQWVAPAGTTDYSYEPGTNRLSQATGAGARYYAHDAYGNRIYQGSTPYTGTPSLIYNEANRLVEVLDADGGFVSVESYRYDAFGRRVNKVGELEFFVYDQAGRKHQPRDGRRDSTAAVLERTVGVSQAFFSFGQRRGVEFQLLSELSWWNEISVWSRGLPRRSCDPQPSEQGVSAGEATHRALRLRLLQNGVPGVEPPIRPGIMEVAGGQSRHRQ